jgi:hypothetical protein
MVDPLGGTMKLVASVPTYNESGRYLRPFIEHLLEFCDEVRVLDDASSDGTVELLHEYPQVSVRSLAEREFFVHEGRFRNRLLEWTLRAEPTHVLSIDADEFVGDGSALRRSDELEGLAWTLTMEEIWKADEDSLFVRVDGGWRRRSVPILWAAPPPGRGGRMREWQVANRALACGREPIIIAQQAIRGKSRETGTSVLHFGWTCEAERRARYARYAVHDQGRFHANSHIESIMLPDDQIRMEKREWPVGLTRDALLQCVRRDVVETDA